MGSWHVETHRRAHRRSRSASFARGVSRSEPPPTDLDSYVARTATDTIAWLRRTELLVTAKQNHYLSRMRELEMEKSLPLRDRCPFRQERVRSLAMRQLHDIRKLLAMARDTLDQLPQQIRQAIFGVASASPSEMLAEAVAFIDGLPALP